MLRDKGKKNKKTEEELDGLKGPVVLGRSGEVAV